MSTAPLIAAKGLAAGYRDRPVLRSVDLDLYPGERMAVLGSNGAGKSTLLHALAGFVPLSAGRIVAFGKPLAGEADFRTLRTRAGLVFQDPDDQLFCPSVIEDVAFGPRNLGLTARQAEDAARAALATLDIEALAQRVPHRLSGGEKRLVAIASVLAMQPEVLLLDEPTGGLDDAACERLFAVLETLPQAMILVAHDAVFVGRLATRAVLIDGGVSRPGVIHDHPHTHAHPHVHVGG